MFIEAKDDGGGGDNWTTGATSRTKLQSNHHLQQTNIHFLQGGCPSCRPTDSVKALKGKYHIPWTCLLYPSSPRVFQLCLWPLIAPGYLGGGSPCLSSALWYQYPSSYIHCVSKSAPTLASCSFDKLGQVFIKSSYRISSVDCKSVEKSITCMQEGKRTSLWTSSKLNWLFWEPPLHNRLFLRATNSLLRKPRYASRHFCRCYLKANNVSKSERTKGSWIGIYHSWKCVDAVNLPKIIKLRPCL